MNTYVIMMRLGSGGTEDMTQVVVCGGGDS